MATRDFDQLFSSEELPLTLPETLLTPFPEVRAVSAAFPRATAGPAVLDKPCFLPWVEFTLENPDEIWENDGADDKKIYHYLSFMERERSAPLFAVEVFSVDDLMQINDYTLILEESTYARISAGNLVYSMSREWERERIIRSLNDTALLKYDENRLDEARGLIDSAISLSGASSAYLYNNRGLICWKMGKTEQAKRDFLESISLDQGNGDPYFNIGLIYFDEADFRRALFYLRRAVDLNPVDSQFLTELGHLYLEMEREDEALELFRRAFENDPADPQIDFHLGYYFLYKKRKPRHAVKYYHKGLKKDPDDQLALADLAVAHWSLGNRRKTLKINRMLEKCSSLMPYTISRLVYLNMEMGDYESALKFYRKALTQKDPFEPEWLHYNAALVYAKKGQPKEALDTLDLAVKVGGEAVLKRAMSDEVLRRLKRTPDFKKLVKLTTKRRNR